MHQLSGDPLCQLQVEDECTVELLKCQGLGPFIFPHMGHLDHLGHWWGDPIFKHTETSLDVKNSWLMGDENPRKVWIEAAEKMSLFAGERVD